MIIHSQGELLAPQILKFIGILQLIKYRSGVNSYNEDIIGVRSNIILASLAPPNPDIWVKTGWLKTHLPQGMQYVCVPHVPGGR